MAKEVKAAGVKVETSIAPSLRKKFQAKVKKNNTNGAQVLRDFVQAYVKK